MSAPLYGLVLAGGRSTRMGKDKAALPVGGRTQLEHAMALLAPHVARAFVSVRPDQRTEPLRGAGVLVVRCRVAVHHRTGVEMEALTGAAVAALTIYDMCKALSHDIEIGGVRLVSKTGGRRPFARARAGRAA